MEMLSFRFKVVFPARWVWFLRRWQCIWPAKNALCLLITSSRKLAVTHGLSVKHLMTEYREIIVQQCQNNRIEIVNHVHTFGRQNNGLQSIFFIWYNIYNELMTCSRAVSMECAECSCAKFETRSTNWATYGMSYFGLVHTSACYIVASCYIVACYKVAACYKIVHTSACCKVASLLLCSVHALVWTTL